MYFIEAAFWRLVGLPYVAEGEVERFQHPPVHIGLFGQRSALAVSPQTPERHLTPLSTRHSTVYMLSNGATPQWRYRKEFRASPHPHTRARGLLAAGAPKSMCKAQCTWR